MGGGMERGRRAKSLESKGDVGGGASGSMFGFVVAMESRGVEACEFGILARGAGMKLMELVSGGGETAVIRLAETGRVESKMVPEGGARCKRIG